MVPPRRLPIFPLSLVLFPGASVPLHLFEPRYRQMLADIRRPDGPFATNRFGIVCGIPGVEERDLPPGRAGCVAEVTEVDAMADGRANIIVVGRDRFVLDQVVADEAPYLVADVLPLEDLPAGAPVALVVAADEVSTRFQRVVAAVRTLSDDDTEQPTLTDDPATMAFAVGAMIDLDLDARQELLAERSAAERLGMIDRVLRKVLPELELRAAAHGA